VTGKGKRPDVIDVLSEDHREIERMFTEIESLRGATEADDVARRKSLLDRVTIELVRHSVAEEAEVYPFVQAQVSREEAERARTEHAAAEETMKRLESLPADDPRVDEEAAALIREVREHIAEEEAELFPHMRLVLGEDELEQLAGKVADVKRIAPTRPHPSAPGQPPGDQVLAPVTGLLDRMRDAVSGRGAHV
jgi:hemerythrin superfamily protein